MADKMWAVYDESGNRVSAAMRCQEFAWLNFMDAHVEGIGTAKTTSDANRLSHVPVFKRHGYTCRQVVVLPVEKYEALNKKPNVVANDVLREIVEEAHEAGQNAAVGSSSYALANQYCTRLFNNKPAGVRG